MSIISGIAVLSPTYRDAGVFPNSLTAYSLTNLSFYRSKYVYPLNPAS